MVVPLLPVNGKTEDKWDVGKRITVLMTDSG